MFQAKEAIKHKTSRGFLMILSLLLLWLNRYGVLCHGFSLTFYFSLSPFPLSAGGGCLCVCVCDAVFETVSRFAQRPSAPPLFIASTRMHTIHLHPPPPPPTHTHTHTHTHSPKISWWIDKVILFISCWVLLWTSSGPHLLIFTPRIFAKYRFVVFHFFTLSNFQGANMCQWFA